MKKVQHSKKMQHENGTRRKKCKAEKLHPEKSVTRKKVHHEKSETCKECKTENYNMKKSVT